MRVPLLLLASLFACNGVSDPGDPVGDSVVGDSIGGDPTPTGDPIAGDPIAGDPIAGDPIAGDPMPGDPIAGDPIAGDPIAGDPMPGDPIAGDPIAGDPLVGDPTITTPCGIVLPPVVVLEATVFELYTAINAAEELAVVDVRTPGETASGVIDGAVLFPWPTALQADHADLPNDRPLYIVCASGNRSGQAATFLVENGHTCVHTVLGGMGAWNTAEYPTVIP